MRIAVDMHEEPPGLRAALESAGWEIDPDSGFAVIDAAALLRARQRPAVVLVLSDDEAMPERVPASVRATAFRSEGHSAIIRRLPALSVARALAPPLRRLLAHDLRGKLGIIAGQCEMLQEEIYGRLNEDQRRAVDSAAAQVQIVTDSLHAGVVEATAAPTQDTNPPNAALNKGY